MNDDISQYNKLIYIADHKISFNVKEGNSGDILFIHGLGCSKESFDEVFFGSWFKGKRLIAPDLLGFGVSSKPSDYAYRMEDHAFMLHTLLNELNSERLIIVAHSMGGAIGLLLLEKIKAIQHFFCLEGNLIGADCFISKKIAAISEKDFIKTQYQKNPLLYRCRQGEEEPAPSPIGYYRSSLSLVKHSESGELFKKFKALKCPKTYIYGEENKNIKAVKLLDNNDVLEINGCGHFMLNDNPSDTYDEIEARLLT